MNFLEERSIQCGSKKLNLSVPVVMGIINLTPDSFFDGGMFNTDDELLIKAETLLAEGATILDIGAVSTRPGSILLSPDDELVRLIRPLKLLRQKYPDTIISVDTYRKDVAATAIAEGADMINDISGGVIDNDMISYMCTQTAAYILMHMQGTPETMQKNPVYEDVVREVGSFFLNQLDHFKKAGKHNIILDPGFGFGKSVDHNFKLLEAINEYTKYGYPLLTGVSRKSMINRVLGTNPANALNGTTVVNTIALLQGADILRVHDVKPAVEAIKLVEQFKESNSR